MKIVEGAEGAVEVAEGAVRHRRLRGGHRDSDAEEQQNRGAEGPAAHRVAVRAAALTLTLDPN